LGDHILSHWPTLYANVKGAGPAPDATFVRHQQDFQLLQLLYQITALYPKEASAIGNQAVGLRKWLVDLIATSDSSYDILIRAIALLPCITGSSSTQDPELLTALRKFQSAKLPLLSSEFPEDSLERTNLLAINRSLFHALTASRSPVLLEFLIHATCADAEHVIEREIGECLAEFVKSLSGDQQLHCLSLSFDFYLNKALDASIRTTILKRFVLTLLKNCQEQQAKLFYAKYIKRICELCESHYVGFGVREVDALTSRCGGFEMIETYAGLFPKDVLNAPDCPVARALLAKSASEVVAGNKVISEFSRRAYKIRTEILVSSDAQAVNLFRKFNCMAYSALCALICSTQVRLEFYNILFKENALKNEFIWKKIVDCNDPEFYDPAYYQLDEYRKVRHTIVSIRKPPDAAPNVGAVDHLPRYIQSQNIYESSLSDDVTKLDMNHVVVRTDADVLALAANPARNNVQITLKKSKINQHEVMPIICGVVRHMFENKVTPVPEFANINTPAPQWVNGICSVIEDAAEHSHVRLFLATVVYNTRDLVRVYAPRLTTAILKLIVDGCVGELLTQFVIDLVVMLLSWNDVYVPARPDDKSYASSVLAFLMLHAHHEQKDIFKLNLELIKVYMELWKDVVILPAQLLYDSLSKSTRPDSRDNVCGIQLNSIVLANGLMPWTHQTRDMFLRAVLMCLANEYVLVHQPAAELMGMCLQRVTAEEAELTVQQVEERLLVMRKKDEKKFTSILYGVQKHFPKILDNFFTIVSSKYVFELWFCNVSLILNLFSKFREMQSVKKRAKVTTHA
jgi:DNA-dependent protein kinase catalytic subunit